MSFSNPVSLILFLNFLATLSADCNSLTREPLDHQGSPQSHFFFFFFRPHCAARRILVPWPGIKPVPPSFEVQLVNHWTSSEIPKVSLLVLPSTLILSFTEILLILLIFRKIEKTVIYWTCAFGHKGPSWECGTPHGNWDYLARIPWWLRW